MFPRPSSESWPETPPDTAVYEPSYASVYDPAESSYDPSLALPLEPIGDPLALPFDAGYAPLLDEGYEPRAESPFDAEYEPPAESRYEPPLAGVAAGTPAPSAEAALSAVFRLLFPAIPPGLAAVGAKWLCDFAFADDQVAAAVDAHAKREVVGDVFDAVDVILCAEQAQLAACSVLRRRVEDGTVSTLKAVVGALNERFTGPMTSEQILRQIEEAVPPDTVGGAKRVAAPVKNTLALHEEASAYLHQAMTALGAGQFADARASLLVVAGIGDTEAAGTALYFLGAIAARRGDVAQARVWFYRSTTGPDPHWARAAIDELRRLA
jgi:hypothetical protein